MAEQPRGENGFDFSEDEEQAFDRVMARLRAQGLFPSTPPPKPPPPPPGQKLR